MTAIERITIGVLIAGFAVGTVTHTLDAAGQPFGELQRPCCRTTAGDARLNGEK